MSTTFSQALEEIDCCPRNCWKKLTKSILSRSTCSIPFDFESTFINRIDVRFTQEKLGSHFVYEGFFALTSRNISSSMKAEKYDYMYIVSI